MEFLRDSPRPDDPEAHQHLGKLLVELGQRSRAHGHLLRALVLGAGEHGVSDDEDGQRLLASTERALTELACLAGVSVRWAPRALALDARGRVLMIGYRSGRGTKWALPGGEREPGETNQQAVAREFFEETSLRCAVRPEPVGVNAFVHESAGDTRIQYGIVYRVDAQTGTPDGAHRIAAWLDDAEVGAIRDGIRPQTVRELVAARPQAPAIIDEVPLTLWH